MLNDCATDREEMCHTLPDCNICDAHSGSHPFAGGCLHTRVSCKPLPPLQSLTATHVLTFLQGVKHREGSWRAWRLSGALLELSAWSSRQQPCLRHHLAARSNSTQEDVLARLQQQLETRCKARRAAVEASRRRHKRQQADDAGWANSDDDMPAASHDTQADSLKISAGQGGLVWCVLLLGVSGMLFIDDRLLVTSGLAAAGLLAAAVSRGLLLPDEASIQQLGRMLHAGGMRANLVSGTPCHLWAVVLSQQVSTGGRERNS